MIRQATFIVVIAGALFFSQVRAADRGVFSPALQRFVPEDNIKIVCMKDGTSKEGILIEKNEKEVILRIEVKGITRKFQIPMSKVESVKNLNACDYIAPHLKNAQLNSMRSYPEKQYVQVISMFDEYCEHCQGHQDYDKIHDARKAFQEELNKLRSGLEKIEGKWYLAIAAAVKKFDLWTDTLAKLEEKYEGIKSAKYSENEKAKDYYDRMVLDRRDIARNLPRLLKERVPKLTSEQRYDDAVSEMTAFLNFWLTRVLTSESEQGGINLQAVLSEMDFSRITELEERIVQAYHAYHDTANKQPPEVMEKDMVYIPGGYFLMGSKNAKLKDDVFPLRIIYVDPFLIDKYEVTNGEYRKFLEHVKSTSDTSMEHPEAPPLKDHTPEGFKHRHLSADEQPVVGIDWFDAYAYAKWVGKRLPTEAEWEYAARSYDGRPFSWDAEGNKQRMLNTPVGRTIMATEIDTLYPPEQEELTMIQKLRGEKPPPPKKTVLPERTWPARSLVAQEADIKDFMNTMRITNPYQLFHITANAAEWVADYYQEDYYRVSPILNPQGPEKGEFRVFRGGDYLTSSPNHLTTFRRSVAQGTLSKGVTGRNAVPIIGLRCVKDLPGEKRTLDKDQAEAKKSEMTDDPMIDDQ